jgi:hypothetical protein
MSSLAETESRARLTNLRALIWLLLLLLTAQFAVGEFTNIYGSIPLVHPGAASGSDGSNFMTLAMSSLNWALFHTQSELRIHILIGLLTGLFALVAMVVGFTTKTARASITCLIGFVLVLGAGIAGLSFLVYADANAGSLVMSLCFLAAFFTYGSTLYLTKSKTQ